MAIWTRDTTIEQLNGGSRGTVLEMMGIAYTEIGEDYLCATMPVNENTRQPYGILHGGSSVVLAESLGSVCGFLCVREPNQYVVGLDINANHIRSKRDGVVTGTSRPYHIGGRTQCWDIRIEDEQNRLICISRLTLAVLTHEGTGGD